MRLLLSVLLSLFALTSSVSADGQGQYNNKQAQQQANVDRQNTISLSANQGVFIQSRSVTYNPAMNGSASTLAYEQVDIATGVFAENNNRKGKIEIQIDNLNVTQSGAGKKPNLQVQQFAFAFRPFSIVQYVEKAVANGTIVQNGFDANDTLCQEYQIRPTAKNQFTWKWLNSTAAPAGNGTTIIQNFEGASADGVFKIILHATGAMAGTNNPAQNKAKAVWIGNRFVSPTSIKFDVVIDVNQPGFKLNTSAACANYQIALKAWARSMQEVWARTTTQQTVNGTTTTATKFTNIDRIQTGGDANPFGFFTWATTAAVTTINSSTTSTAKVLATSLRKVTNDEDKDDLHITKEAVHSFDAIRPGLIKWDPEFGSDSTNPDMATTDAPTSASNPSTSPSSTPTDATPTTTSSPTSSTGTSAPSGRPNAATETTISFVTMAHIAIIALFA